MRADGESADPFDMLGMTVIVVFNFRFVLIVLAVLVVLNEQICHILKKRLCNRLMLKQVCYMRNVFHFQLLLLKV